MLYIIKVNLILALLCLLFQVLMHRDTFFGVRRLMLWGIYATAFLLPLCDVQALLTADTAATDMAEGYASYVLPTIEVTAMRVSTLGIEQSEPGCGMWFVGMMALWAILYLIPVVWMTLKLLWQIAYIIYLRCTCPLIKQLPSPFGEGVGVRCFPRPCSPFSFGPWIFIHPDGMDEQTLREVLIHEQAHVRGWHTLDILFSQVVCILFWWNPAAWLMRREVRMNLEFIADKAVADSLSPIPMGGALKAYQYRLLGFATQTNVATIANNFNVLPLKRRIKMMNLQRTRRTGMVKYLLFVPAVAALLLLSNIDALARAKDVNVQEPLTVVDGGDPIYEKVDKLPQYAGGEQALYRALAESIRYPEVAQEWGVQARVFIQFVVEKDGTLSDIKVLSAKDPVSGQVLPEIFMTSKADGQTPEEAENAQRKAEKQTEGLKAIKAEAVRAVKQLPGRWQPGKQGGKPVRVRFLLPVMFRLR
jgi:hypothetical protein